MCRDFRHFFHKLIVTDCIADFVPNRGFVQNRANCRLKNVEKEKKKCEQLHSRWSNEAGSKYLAQKRDSSWRYRMVTPINLGRKWGGNCTREGGQIVS